MLRDTVVSGWRLGDWAAHRQIDTPHLFGLSLMPIGLSLPFVWASFRSLGNAVGAMREIGRSRNDWHRVTQADFNRALEARLRAICAHHHAVEGPVQMAVAAHTGLLMNVK